MKMQIIFGGPHTTTKGPMVDVSSMNEAISTVKKFCKGNLGGAWGVIPHNPPLTYTLPEREGICCTLPERECIVPFTTVYKTGHDSPEVEHLIFESGPE